ncbi:MAG: hypothetical protein HOP18_27190 [Deltaproteobacteria bacterium]|nr:hypothetical protein [Deltaproteobacteria bacterium]
MNTTRTIRRFPLGHVVATPGALAALDASGQSPHELLARHVAGDWGDVSEADWQENERSLRAGFRVLSAYTTNQGTTLWVITEADRSVTTLLLPSDY